jgi:hypothetical protein
MDSDLLHSPAFRRLRHRMRRFWDQRPPDPDTENPWLYWINSLFYDFAGRRISEFGAEAVPRDEVAIRVRVLAEVRECVSAPEEYWLPRPMCERLLVPDLFDHVEAMVAGGVRRGCEQMLEDEMAADGTLPHAPKTSQRRSRRKPTQDDKARGAAIKAALEPYRDRHHRSWEGLAGELGMGHSAFWDLLAGKTKHIPRAMRKHARKLNIPLPPD